MTTDYNLISEQYKKAKTQPSRAAVESYSLMRLAGDLSGKSVVNVACGEGFFTRKLRQAGAARVVGLDISERMIELAKAEEASNPLGIEYLVEDARAEQPRREFDLAVAAWLLVYAHDRDELGQMCRGLARLLKPGGRFVTYTTNPGLYFFELPNYRKYGFSVRIADRAFEGAPIDWSIDLGDATLEIQNYYLPIEAYETAFEAAGFRDFAVHPPRLAPEAEAADGVDHWKDFLEPGGDSDGVHQKVGGRARPAFFGATNPRGARRDIGFAGRSFVSRPAYTEQAYINRPRAGFQGDSLSHLEVIGFGAWTLLLWICRLDSLQTGGGKSRGACN